MKFVLIGPNLAVDFGVWPSYPYKKKIEFLQTLEFSSKSSYAYTRSNTKKMTHSLVFKFLSEEKLLEILNFFDSELGANGKANTISFKHWNGQTITNCKFIPTSLVYNKNNYNMYALGFSLEERQ